MKTEGCPDLSVALQGFTTDEILEEICKTERTEQT